MRPIEDDSRALRRAERARLKKNRRFWWRIDHAEPGWEDAWGRLVDTPTPCSCPMCGNERKYFGIPTMQERRESQPGAHPDPWQAYCEGSGEENGG